MTLGKLGWMYHPDEMAIYYYQENIKVIGLHNIITKTNKNEKMKKMSPWSNIKESMLHKYLIGLSSPQIFLVAIEVDLPMSLTYSLILGQI